ncbi:MAG: STAS domain-containing protein [Firmicutes bacterium]|nr:STAS domain-containing protein [Bacillota bacterium]
MDFKTEHKNYQGRDWLVVAVGGELDLSAAGPFKDKLKTALAKSRSRCLMLDFSRVSFIDSSGLGVLMGRYRELALNGGRIVIRHANDQVYRLLTASGLDRLIEVEPPVGGHFAKEERE